MKTIASRMSVFCTALALALGATPLQVSLLLVIDTVVILLLAPYWGRLSDRLGRRPVIALALATAPAAYLLLAYADSLAILFVARACAGVSNAAIPVIQALVADTTGDDWEADRIALESRDLSMTDFLTRRGLVLRSDLLGAWAGWLTPVFEPRRYRTWFFVAALPEGQRTRDVSSESSRVTWLPAADAVAAVDAERILMMPPTYLTCLELAEHGDPAEVLASAAGRTVEIFTPEVVADAEEFTLSRPERLEPLIERHLG